MKDLDLIGSWPRTAATEAALRLTAEHAPEFLLNHSIRSYFYAQSIGLAQGLVAGADYDDEVLFLATVLHDIGLTGPGGGPNRYEVDGAFRAADLAREHGLSDQAVERLWDAIALHTSAGIAAHKRPEVALAHFGIGADIFGFGAERVDRVVREAAHAEFPWLDLREQLIETVAEQIDAQPSKWAPMSFVDAAYRRARPGSKFPGLNEVVAAPVLPA